MYLEHDWKCALRLIQETFPEAVIAGGCLRDGDHGVKVKDVDIFIREFPLWSDREMLERLGQKLGLKGSTTIKYESIEYIFGMDSDVQRVFDFDLFQVIALKKMETLEDVVGRIDFGLCRIGTNGDRAYISPDYVVDKAGKQFTLLRCESNRQYNRSMARYDRLKEKYPEHRLVIPESFKVHADFDFLFDGEL
jgi:hypothetical protein